MLIALRYEPDPALDYVLGWTEVDATPERIPADGDDAIRAWVSGWLEERRSLLAAVRSQVLPEADVVLLNPLHPEPTAWRRSSRGRSASPSASTLRRCWLARRLATVPAVEGWETWHRQTGGGAVESEQRVALDRRSWSSRARAPSGSAAPTGARCAVSLAPRQAPPARERARAAGARRPGSVRFGAPTVEADDTRVICSYPILGGLLASRAAGEITFEQTTDAMRSTIRDFFPRRRARATDRLQRPRARCRQPPLLPPPDRRGREMKVVVFGATGTIGRPLVDALAQEHDVTSVSRHEHPVGERHLGGRRREGRRLGGASPGRRRGRLLPGALAGRRRLRGTKT